jgi:site-specific recombinase XerD
MKSLSFPSLLEQFFDDRLRQQRKASPHTIASYRDTFCLLFEFAQRKIGKSPSSIALTDIDVSLITGFLNDIEERRGSGASTRNLRLTAIRSFCRFAEMHDPLHCAHFKRILAIPNKRQPRKEINFLNRFEIETLLDAPDRNQWIGRRDHALLLLALQTGLRLSELTSLDRNSLILKPTAYVCCFGKGRKERYTPFTKKTAAIIKAWLKEPPRKNTSVLFPSIHGNRLSADAVQYLLKKYVRIASEKCPSLKRKHITPHCLRHSAAMELLSAGVDSSVIALWLGHESVKTTQTYLHAHMALKEEALAKINPINTKPKRYHADDNLLEFLKCL